MKNAILIPLLSLLACGPLKPPAVDGGPDAGGKDSVDDGARHIKYAKQMGYDYIAIKNGF